MVTLFQNCSFAFYSDPSKTNVWNKYFETVHYFLNIHEVSSMLNKVSNSAGNQSKIVGLRAEKNIFGQCIVIIYPKRLMNELTAQQYDVFTQKRQPIFFIFFYPTEETFKEGNANCYNNVVKRINFPVIFLEMVNFKRARFICTACKRTYTNIFGNGDIVDVSELETTWNQLHSNFNRNFIIIMVLQKWNVSKFDSCMAYSPNEISEKECTLVVLANKLNFTIKFAQDSSSDTRQSYDYIGDLHPIYPVTSINLRDYSPKNYDWLPYGVKATPYSFITVIDYKTIPPSFHSLMQPLDYSTQFLTVISNLMILLLFTFFSDISPLKFLQQAAFASLALVLEQPGRNLFAIEDSLSKPKKFIKSFILTIWLFATWQIVGLYKSSIFSYLSVHTNPTSPNSLNQLIQSKISILTFSVMSEFNETGFIERRSSTFRDKVVAEMLRKRDNQLSSDFSNDLEYLHENLEWEDNTMTDFLLNRILNENKATFAFFDKKEYVETVRIMIAIFSKNWASNIVLVPIFMERRFWIVYKNAFRSPFTKYLSRLYESGIYSWWKADFIFRIRRKVGQDIANSLTRWDWKKYSVGRAVEQDRFFNFLLFLLNGDVANFETVENVPKVVYKYVAITSSIIIFIAGNVFFIECTFEFLKKPLLICQTKIRAKIGAANLKFKDSDELKGNPYSYSSVPTACDICYNHTVHHLDVVFKEMVLEWILQSNSRIALSQRFTSKNILLVSDSIFPSKRFGHGLLQTDINRHLRYTAMNIPSVILLETSLTASNILKVDKSTRIIISEMTSALLIFVDSNLKFVSIGCFTCEQFVEHYAKEKSVPMYPVSFEYLHTKSLGAFQNLEKYWKNLHSKIQFNSIENSIAQGQNCDLNSNHKSGETCEIYKSFFRDKNCTSFVFCLNYFSDDLKLQLTQSKFLDFRYLSQIFPFVLKQTGFKLQVLLPKVHALESGLGAYLTPFDIKIWICTIISIFGIFLWLWKKEGKKVTLVIFWQFATFVEQDGPQLTLRRRRHGGKVIVLVWMMVTILLRFFYTASLYSFMTAEMEPIDFPQTIEKAVQRDDFELLLTSSFSTELFSWFWLHPLNHLPQVRNFYFGIITKAFVMNQELEIQTVKNLSTRNFVKVMHYPHVNRDAKTMVKFLTTSPLFQVEKTFSKFGTLCEGDCNSNSNVILVGQKTFRRFIPDQISPLLQSFEVWTLRYTNFATLSFPNYFGSFVHSGLYEFSIQRYRLLSQVKNMQILNEYETLGMSNASLYSFVFLANQKEVYIEKEEPTNISVLKGMLLIGTFMLSLALTVFLFELREYIKK
ncbi:unnamed protein product [Orchesella dallaii]|uniref:Uncharacterized protein n=1 Tax=Orchesella dallaii TaxID=48710 RepID=A0ABP1RHN2_9HEXA